jgi:excisionase family DNA binding protein
MLDHAGARYKAAPTALLTFHEVAKRLAVSPATVRRLVRSGELTKVVIGGSVRVEPSEVEALIARGRREDSELSTDAATAPPTNDEGPAARPGLVKASPVRGRHGRQ